MRQVYPQLENRCNFRTGQLDAAAVHVVDVRLRGGVAVLEGPLPSLVSPQKTS
jgi:hypothetical protein